MVYNFVLPCLEDVSTKYTLVPYLSLALFFLTFLPRAFIAFWEALDMVLEAQLLIPVPPVDDSIKLLP